MITFRKVDKADLELNSKIDELNFRVFPSSESVSNLHYLASQHKGATVDFIAIEDEGVFVGYTYMINFFQGSFIYYLAIVPGYQSKGYGTALLRHLREIQGTRPIVLTISAPLANNDDYEECIRRKWFYVKNSYVDQKIPYPSEDAHHYDIFMNGFGISYIELMAMLDKVNMFIISRITINQILSNYSNNNFALDQ